MYRDIDIDNVLDIDTDTDIDIDNNLGGANFWTPPTPDKGYIRTCHERLRWSRPTSDHHGRCKGFKSTGCITGPAYCYMEVSENQSTPKSSQFHRFLVVKSDD